MPPRIPPRRNPRTSCVSKRRNKRSVAFLLSRSPAPPQLTASAAEAAGLAKVHESEVAKQAAVAAGLGDGAAAAAAAASDGAAPGSASTLAEPQSTAAHATPVRALR